MTLIVIEEEGSKLIDVVIALEGNICPSVRWKRAGIWWHLVWDHMKHQCGVNQCRLCVVWWDQRPNQQINQHFLDQILITDGCVRHKHGSYIDMWPCHIMCTLTCCHMTVCHITVTLSYYHVILCHSTDWSIWHSLVWQVSCMVLLNRLIATCQSCSMQSWLK